MTIAESGWNVWVWLVGDTHKLKVWMTIVESGWNLWVWLVGVVSRRRVWLVGVGRIYGCGCKEVYRFPHITYPYSSCICSFSQQHPIPTFCSLTLGAHAPEGYSTWSVCVCVCVFSLFWHLAQSGVQTAVSATSARYGHEI